MTGLEVYSRQGFGQVLDVKAPLALLIVDFINAFADPSQFGGGNIPEAIRATIPVLSLFRKRAASDRPHAHCLCR
jgi:maleamate amidohydrolase